jgi:hypothetical protein
MRVKGLQTVADQTEKISKLVIIRIIKSIIVKIEAIIYSKRIGIETRLTTQTPQMCPQISKIGEDRGNKTKMIQHLRKMTKVRIVDLLNK